MYETESGKAISEKEFEVVQLFRQLRPYGKIEIAMNQNGFEATITLVNPIRKVVEVSKKL